MGNKVSSCCGANFHGDCAAPGHFEGTCWCVCDKCNKPCALVDKPAEPQREYCGICKKYLPKGETIVEHWLGKDTPAKQAIQPTLEAQASRIKELEAKLSRSVELTMDEADTLITNFENESMRRYGKVSEQVPVLAKLKARLEVQDE